MDDFLNQRSELFAYYKQKEFSVVPCEVHSLDEAIEDYDIRVRDYENLVFSAANLNRPI
eukprot:CAMPEP_0185596466 /NCGR_PEP_ID=MMETSP0434-20130131/80774_1 /TAXON_ID=626734 ORGANISM="Favella taraikaensis, Strain Fe Narragansett Bay" /NCGR_SAMPLE_ID=MMETSP0434 /ASSEMBLY_ACC=CAM_ASM_000379 /LENGTH=58 /DNA_ID=CAMNT_0028224977 /DNA_START=1509 /DNA_END=1685 /DNA_ORIENTATION=-